MTNKLLVIAGPTGVGKTDLSIKLAKKLNGEVVSADSMQIYKYMDIGSAKVTKEEMDDINHHMIDVIEPDEPFTVVDYKNYAEKEIEKILNKNKTPIIAGGTGLYINALTCNMNFTEAETDLDYRKELEKVAIEKGNEYLHSQLKEIDPISYEKIHFNNVKRVIRALEVYKLTKKPFSSYNNLEEFYQSKYDVYYYVLTMDREKLYDRINKRVDKMIQDGLVEECNKLKALGYTDSMQSIQGIGYKEMFYYLDKKITLDEAIDMIKQGSRNYAKRQLTWFRKDPRVKFIDKDKYSEEEIINLIISDFSK